MRPATSATCSWRTRTGSLWGVTVHGRGGRHGDDGQGRHGHDHGRWLVADLSGLLVSDLAAVIPGLPYDERGFLGLAFDPDFRRTGLLYTFTSEDPTAPADFTTQPGSRPAADRQWSPSGRSRTGVPTRSRSIPLPVAS